jgi:dUTP pyrophosphatase
MSDKCVKSNVLAFRDIEDNRSRNGGSYVCFFCSRKKFMGRNNPNCKYSSIQDDFFCDVNTSDKAYLLGWIASDGTVTKNGFTIAIHEKDIECLIRLRDIICNEIPIKRKKGTKLMGFTCNSNKMAEDIMIHLGIDPKVTSRKKHDVVKFPLHVNSQYHLDFIRGFFDGDGWVTKNPKKFRAGITSSSLDMLKTIQNIIGIKSTISVNSGTCYALTWNSSFALKFLDGIYSQADNPRLTRKFEIYAKYIESKADVMFSTPSIKIFRDSDAAILPTRAHDTDSGFDITIIGVHSKISDDVTLFKTGLRIVPEPGYYTEIVARSSLMKLGYMLANNIGIIDNRYRGELLVALYKFNQNLPDIQLPIRAAQFIPRKIINVDVIDITDEQITTTDRGAGGFGSTGK